MGREEGGVRGPVGGEGVGWAAVAGHRVQVAEGLEGALALQSARKVSLTNARARTRRVRVCTSKAKARSGAQCKAHLEQAHDLQLHHACRLWRRALLLAGSSLKGHCAARGSNSVDVSKAWGLSRERN